MAGVPTWRSRLAALYGMLPTIDRAPLPATNAKTVPFFMACGMMNMHVYHHHSYANNAHTLRSTKPMIMRDVFLTRAHKKIPNPLSALYYPHMSDVFFGSLWCWWIAVPTMHFFGWRHTLALYLTGAWASSFAWLFQAEINPSRLGSPYDCTATSRGGWCAVSVLALHHLASRVPGTRKTPVWPVALHCIGMSLYEEYVLPINEDTTCHNAGAIGGVFAGLIYYRLFMVTMLQKRAVGGILGSVSGKGMPSVAQSSVKKKF